MGETVAPGDLLKPDFAKGGKVEVGRGEGAYIMFCSVMRRTVRLTY